MDILSSSLDDYQKRTYLSKQDLNIGLAKELDTSGFKENDGSAKASRIQLFTSNQGYT